MSNLRLGFSLSKSRSGAVYCRRADLLRILLLGLCLVLCATSRDGARADLLVQWSALDDLVRKERPMEPLEGTEETQPDVEFTIEEDASLHVAAGEIFENPRALEIASLPQHGHVQLHADGGFTYRPEPNYSGMDAFDVRWVDATGRVSRSRMMLFVEPRNDPPSMAPTVFTATAGEALRVVSPGLLEGSHDADGDALWIALDTPPGHGEVVLDDDGGFTYVPEAGFTGIDTFTCELSDGVETATGSVRIAVQPPPPVTLLYDATDDATVCAIGANVCYGSEPQLHLRHGAATQRGYLRFSVLGTGDGVQRATLRLFCLDSSPDGGRLHRVSNDFRGTRSPWDQRRLSWNNAPPLAAGALTQLGAVSAGTWVEIDVTDVVRGDGVVSFGLASRSSDGVRYSSKEGVHPPQLEIVTILQREPDNQRPVAMDDAYEIAEDTPLEVYPPGLLENDADEDGDYLVLVSRSQPAHGILVVDEEGGFEYRPHTDYHGPDSFTYCVSDLRGGMDTRTVAITVLPEEDSPVAEADSWLLRSMEPFRVASPGILANDVDGDEEPLTAELLTDVTHGTLVLAEDGSFTYTPDAGYRGTDAFVYQASDGGAASLPAVVSLHVEAPSGAGKATLPEQEPATALDRIFPNPFGSGTWIEYRLGQFSHVEAELYDVRGKRVRLLTSALESPGPRSLYWNGDDDRGVPLPTGIYFLRLRLGDHLRTRKLVRQR